MYSIYFIFILTFAYIHIFYIDVYIIYITII